MDYELNADQSAICEAVESLLEKHAGPARAIALSRQGDYDFDLHAAIRAAGFDRLGEGPETGTLEAALVVEAIARSSGVVAFSATGLVLPAVLAAVGAGPCSDELLAGPLALVEKGVRGPVRFGSHARNALLLDGEDASLVALQSGAGASVRSNFGYPLGTIEHERLEGGERLPSGAGTVLRNWWRVALAIEAVGTMSAALAQTTDYLKQRRQFGRTIASFQAVAHRLAECAIVIEGSRWLSLEAAYHGAPVEKAASSAAYALAAADQVFGETHQLSGAIGFTHEHDLHVWSMRLQALRVELGGVGRHRDAVSRERWGIGR